MSFSDEHTGDGCRCIYQKNEYYHVRGEPIDPGQGHTTEETEAHTKRDRSASNLCREKLNGSHSQQIVQDLEGCSCGNSNYIPGLGVARWKDQQEEKAEKNEQVRK